MKGLAIASVNRSRYSETFIRSHLEHLADHILYLFGGYLPTHYSEDKLVSEQEIISAEKMIAKAGQQKKYSLPSELSKLLVKKNIRVLLAEYGPAGVELISVCKEVGIPLVVHFHGFDAYRTDVIESYGKEYRSMFNEAAAVIVVSQHMQKQVLDLGCPANKLHHIPYGINTKIFTGNPVRTNKERFVACGRFVAKKGPEYTIRSFEQIRREFPNTSLVMIGDGELLNSCKDLVVTLGISDAVRFTGALEQSEVAKIFAESSFFLQHSITTDDNDSEGLPLAILEAGSSGLIIIATNHGGIPDVIENGKNGCVVGEKKTGDMAEKVLFLLRHPDQSESMAKTFQEEVQRKYTMERYIGDLRNLLQKISRS